MRLRQILVGLFIGMTLLPLAVFWAWPFSAAMRQELDDVDERHLLLARNIGAALVRYHRDLTATFELVAENLAEGHAVPHVNDMLRHMSFRHVCLAVEQTGEVVGEAGPRSAVCPPVVPLARLERMRQLASDGRTHLTEVLAGPDGRNLIYVVRRYGDKLAIGALYTDYFQQLTDAVAFGTSGHAVIVDSQGQVLAHPLASWVAERRSLVDVAPVRRMLAGETGIERFESPAFGGMMIAGFTAVRGPDWGVMIPQSLTEIESKARKVDRSALLVLSIGLTLAVLLGLVVSRRLCQPIVRLIDAVKDAASPRSLAPVPVDGHLVPHEFRVLSSSFNAMIERLQADRCRINELAYIDATTGLFNRAAFRAQVERHIASSRDSAALLFLDLNGFKQVNDQLGHDTGDVLLRRFAVRIAEQVGVTPTPDATMLEAVARLAESADSPTPAMDVLLARMGGDEFGLLVRLDEAEASDGEHIQIASRIIDALAQPIDIEGSAITLGLSIGIALYPSHGRDFRSLFRGADKAMYAAKRSGRNTWRVFDPTLAVKRDGVHGY